MFIHIYQKNYEFGLGRTGLVFLAPWLGNLLGCAIYFGCFQLWFNKQKTNLQARNDRVLSQDPLAYVQVELKPESRLPGLLTGVLCFSGGLLWFALTSSRPQLHYMIPVSSGLLIGFGTSLFIVSLSAYASDLYPNAYSPVWTANLFVRGIFAAFCPSFALPMYTSVGVENAGLILTGIGLLGLPMVCVLWTCGSCIRRSSKRAAQDEAFVMRDVTIDLSPCDQLRKDSDHVRVFRTYL